MRLSLIQRAVIVALGGFVAWSTTTTARAQQIGTVFVISMENHNLTQPVPLSDPEQIKGNVAAPFLNSLMTPGNPNAAESSFATNYQNVGSGIHPSAPNYIWSQGGSNFGVLNDNDPYGTGGSAQTTSQNLSNYLQTAGITWKAYEEDIDINTSNNTVLSTSQWTVPLTSTSGTFTSGTNAYNGSNQYSYDDNHDPMIYFTDTDGGNNSTPSNPLAHNYAPLQQLQTDLANNTTAQYNWITPDLYNTAHSSLPSGFTYHGTHYTGDQAAVAQGDNFLSIVVPMIEASHAYLNNGAIIIWFDETEGGDTPNYTIPEIIISPLAQGNAYSNNVLYTHSSDLLTTEEIFNVGPCIRAACGANDLSLLFKPGAINGGPTLTSISPSTGSQGSSVPVTLTGTGFVAPVTINAGSGITVSNVSVVNSTQITATLAIAASAAVGQQNISVTAAGGTTGNVAFNVTAAASGPALTSISPSTGSQGSSVPVTLTGTGFVAPLTVNASGSGITASNVSVVSSTQATATLAIAASAGTGQHNVSVTTTAGTSGTTPFTVTAASSLPTLTSITPSSGALGSSVNVTLTGTNFTSASQVRLQGNGLTQTNIVVVSPTQITATYNISSSAATGSHNTWIVTGAGSSNILTFTVTAATSAPTLTSITPNSGVQGTSVNVTLAGTNFISGATVGATGSGITVSNVAVASSTQITATLTLAANATLGASSLSVTTSGGISNTVPFTVNAPPPTLSSITPNSGTQGTAVNVTLTGTNFISGATVTASGSGITVSNVVVASSTKITATFTLAANATLGASNISVATSGGGTTTVPFTVNAAVPTLTSVTPNSGVQGTAVNVTLVGTNFIAGATVGATGSGITVSNVTVVSSTQITAILNIAANAGVGQQNVSVTTAGGTTGNVSFNVTAAASAPTLTSISPSIGSQGSSVPVTFTGTGFVAPLTVNAGGSGITVSNVSVVSSTQATATLAIAASAGVGQYNVSVTTTAGTSGTTPFTVNAASSLPTLTSVTPSSGARGTSVNVTLTGTNFTSASQVRLQGNGLTQTNIVVVSPTQITATYNISSGVATGPHNTWIVTGAGSSNILTFTVN